jgi:hypothetical protein
MRHQKMARGTHQDDAGHRKCAGMASTPILDWANRMIRVDAGYIMPRMTGAKFMVQTTQAYR